MMTEPTSAGHSGPKQGRRKAGRPVSGVLLLDKPVGITSNRALQTVKRLFKARKAGHTGSLDPLASGMLPLCFGEATKVSGYLLGADKCYRTVARYGARTATGDADGEVVERSAVPMPDQTAIEAALEQFRGSIEQIPPMYSALKKDGKRLYELAREGQVVPRDARPVTIYELELEECGEDRAVFNVRCSKGTYIRTLVEDIAAATGHLAHVAELRRLTVSSFHEQQMIELKALEKAAEAGLDALDALLLPVDEALTGWPDVHLGPQESYYLRNGHTVSVPDRAEEGLVRLYDASQSFVGIGEVLADGRVAPKRLFASGELAAR